MDFVVVVALAAFCSSLATILQAKTLKERDGYSLRDFALHHLKALNTFFQKYLFQMQ